MSKNNSVLLFTVMKNEGPFILEWIAYNRAIGVDKFLIFTNDCDDGTDQILDRLDDLSIVRHSPNPSSMGKKHINKANHPHIVGLDYAKFHREWREADWIFFSDVDEFLDIYTEQGTICSLIEAAGSPDVISISEKVFGSGLHERYVDKPVIEQFLRCSSSNPGKWRARKGVKSLCRNKPEILDIRNHRPIVSEQLASELNWVDGAGESLPLEFRSEHIKGLDVRGRYKLGAINHYTLRSMESFLCKVERGDAVAQYEDRLDWIYFKRRNRQDDFNDHVLRMRPRFLAELNKLMSDEILAELHYKTVRHHRSKINRLKASPKYENLYAQLLGTIEESADFIRKKEKNEKSIHLKDESL